LHPLQSFFFARDRHGLSPVLPQIVGPFHLALQRGLTRLAGARLQSSPEFCFPDNQVGGLPRPVCCPLFTPLFAFMSGLWRKSPTQHATSSGRRQFGRPRSDRPPFSSEDVVVLFPRDLFSTSFLSQRGKLFSCLPLFF